MKAFKIALLCISAIAILGYSSKQHPGFIVLFATFILLVVMMNVIEKKK